MGPTEETGHSRRTCDSHDQSAEDGRRELIDRRRPPGCNPHSTLRSDALNEFPPAGLARRSNWRKRLTLAEWNLPLLRCWGWAIGPIQVTIESPSPGFRARLARLSTSTNRCRSRHHDFSISTTTGSASRMFTAWNACAALPARSLAPACRDRDNRDPVWTADARRQVPSLCRTGSFRHISSPFVITSLRWPEEDRPEGRLTASLPGQCPTPDVRYTL